MYMAVKRGVDITVAIAALVSLSPIMALASLSILITMGRPIIFKQTRPGRYQQPFEIYKFRSMNDRVDSIGQLLPDAERITVIGRFLRRSSIDELPQLLNILRGDMSLIGPRPLLVRYLPHYRPEELERFRVRPGVAGLAQVRGRNSLRWDERLAADVEYVRNLGPMLDIKIAAAAAKSVLRRTGIVDVPSSTMKSLDEERSDAN